MNLLVFVFQVGLDLTPHDGLMRGLLQNNETSQCGAAKVIGRNFVFLFVFFGGYWFI